ncbi:MAG: hypothetical protein EOP84_08575 [Verrucomicrobiaceae bacterium]|nr:MAG: hypothetical protein EOP84_08575 [Verrucomicrobiaceae bacterium]
MIAIIIYTLCVLTCWTCTFLLFRGFRTGRSPLLLWSSVCFLFLGLANLVLFLDLIVYPGASLAVFRSALTLVGLIIFIVGLVFQAK